MNIDNDSSGNPIYSDYHYEELDRVNKSLADNGSKTTVGGTENNDYNGFYGMNQYPINNNRSGQQMYGNTNDLVGFNQKGAEYTLNINMNMPGRFVVYDQMEEDSPPFTLDLYHDPIMEMVSKEQDISMGSPNQFNQPGLAIIGAMDPRELDSNGRQYSISISSHTPENLQTINDDQNNLQMQNSQLGSDSNTNMYGGDSRQVNQMNNHYNDLSPLTTTTSLTPSIGSVYSNQPSFFSAHQYITRSSLDQPPTSIHRQSIDLFPNNRPSIDSQRSAQRHRPQNNGRYASFTNSITNYIPFINGNQRSPDNSPNSTSIPVSPHGYNLASPIQNRYKIRSIFKSSQGQSVNANDENNEPVASTTNIKVEDDGNEFLLMSPTKEYAEADQLFGSTNGGKKPKKPKRSIFTRFKTPVKTEAYDGNDPFRREDSSKLSNEISSFEHGNISGQDSLNQSVSSSTTAPNSTVGVSEYIPQGSFLSNNESGGSSQQEPDYAALFEKVGKRKNIVSKKSKSKLKAEPINLNIIENDILNNSLSNLDINRTEGIKQEDESSCSSNISSNNTSLADTKKTGFMNNSSTTSTFANASKRILGSKLILKKKDIDETYIIDTDISKDVDVEIDLESLDLPPNTQIFPSSIISSKTRIRGRKENKEADLVDFSKIYQCNYCSRRFKRQEHLKRHFRSLHTFEKPYECSICQKKFSRADNLGQHLKIHKQEEMENLN